MVHLEKIAKFIVLSLLGFIIFFVTFIIVDNAFLSYGVELHMIFESPRHLWLQVAFKMLVKYVATVSILVSLLIFGGYPFHWSTLAMGGIIIIAFKWWNIRLFFYQECGLDLIIFCLSVFIFIYIAWLSHRLKRRFYSFFLNFGKNI